MSYDCYYVVRKGNRVVYRGKNVDRVRGFAPEGRPASKSPDYVELTEFGPGDDTVKINRYCGFYKEKNEPGNYGFDEVFKICVAKADLISFLRRDAKSRKR